MIFESEPNVSKVVCKFVSQLCHSSHKRPLIFCQQTEILSEIQLADFLVCKWNPLKV